MSDFEEIPVETVEGSGSRSPLPERLALSLAVLALIGGLLIAGANLLGGMASDEAATASATPVPTAAAAPKTNAPRPSPTPRSLREVTVAPLNTGSPPEEPEPSRDGWLEVMEPAPLRFIPSADADPMEVLEPGTILIATRQGDSGWVQTAEGSARGFIGWVRLTADDGSVTAVFHPTDTEVVSGAVLGIWAGPNGLVAAIDQPHQAGADAQPVLIASADGERWTLARGRQPYPNRSIAYGPAGWITIGDYVIWNSYDGVAWNELGELLIGRGPFAATSLVGSPRGYLAVLTQESARNASYTVWFSPDGITWQESPDPFGRFTQIRPNDDYADEIRVIGTDSGFVAWTGGYGSGHQPQVAVSDDGFSWRPIAIETPTLLAPLQLMTSDMHLLGIAQAELTGAVWAWSLDLRDPAAQLQRDREAESILADLTPLVAASDGRRSYYLGVDPQTLAAHLYLNAGDAWRRVRVPANASLGFPTPLGAVGPQGLVLIGSERNAAGFNPTFWHLRDDGSWVAETEPIVSAVPDPSPGACGPVPATALEFMLLPRAWGPVCFDDQPMTFTAWAADCEWCGAAPTQPPGNPAGFLDYPDLALRPAPGDSWPNREAVFTPTLTPAIDFAGQWVRVTGHYADPAAAWCGDAYGSVQYPPEEAVIGCRQRFVVTAISVVDGP